MSQPAAPRVSIIIVNWNTRDLLLSCIESIKINTTDIPHEIIVVDNSSSDGSAESVCMNHPDVSVIASSDNLGFAGGNNLGATEATGDYLLLLNPDTLVPPGAVSGLVEFMEAHPEVGVAGPQLLGKDGGPQISSFGIFPCAAEALIHSLHLWRLMPRSRLARRFLTRPPDSQTWCYTAHLLGACMLVRREVWESVDGMDSGYFLFLEETDFCLRVSKNGWRCAYTNAVHITHIGEQSLGSIPDKSGGLYIRSYRRFCRKHRLGFYQCAAADFLLVSGTLCLALASLLKRRNPRKAAGVIRSLWYGYLRSPDL